MTAWWRALRRQSIAAPSLSAQTKRTIFVLALGCAFLATHLPFVAPGPGTVDAANFALGVREFDLTDHQPHAPGYPVFIALGKVARALVPAGSADLDSVSRESRALAVWSVIFGAIAVFPLFVVFRALELDDRRAAAATTLTVMCPLFWFTAVRGMSDIPGLGAACIAQALLFAAHRRSESSERLAWPLLLIGAVVSGLAVGLRSQTMWLTMPLLIVVSIAHVRRHVERPARFVALVGHAFAAGVALWAVPLVAASGGPRSYLATLGLQRTDDFTDVNMLVTNPGIERLASGLVSTFGYPWANKYLAGAVLLLAAVGLFTTIARSRAALGWLAVAGGPYTMFHLLYQDPVFSRYALPVVPAVAYLAVCGVQTLWSRVFPAAVGALAAACLAIAASPVMLYSATGGPGFQAITAVREAVGRQDGPRPVLATHHAVGLAIRGERVAAPRLAFPIRHEWLEVVRHFRERSAPVWFLADSGRTDLALIDPASRRVLGQFRLPFTNRFFLSGARPGGVDWYEIVEPGWMLGEGWALTPETAGVAWRDEKSPGLRPVTAWLRRRSEPTLVMLGGRNLGRPSEPDVTFDVSLDGRLLSSFTVAPDPGFFLKSIPLAAGALEGAGRYATLAVSARPSDGVIRPVQAAIEQFDAQSATRPMIGLGRGWYPVERDRVVRRLFRWTGSWAALQMFHASRDLTLYLSGEAPLDYTRRIPTVTVRAGDQVLHRFTPAGAFEIEVVLPAASLAATQGEVILESDVSFVPDEQLHNGDLRPLSLRIFDVALK